MAKNRTTNQLHDVVTYLTAALETPEIPLEARALVIDARDEVTQVLDRIERSEARSTAA